MPQRAPWCCVWFPGGTLWVGFPLPVPAHAPRASSPPPCASVLHSVGAVPAPAASGAPSLASVAVGDKQAPC